MLKTNRLFNMKIATIYGDVVFDANGESQDLKEDEQVKFAEHLMGVTFIADKKEEPEVKEEVKEELKVFEGEPELKEEEVKEEPKPKVEPKKAPAKKKTTTAKAKK